MRKELQYVIGLVGLGASLVIYAHNTFSTKSEAKTTYEIVKRIDNRVYNLVKHYGLLKK